MHTPSLPERVKTTDLLDFFNQKSKIKLKNQTNKKHDKLLADAVGGG